MQYITKIQALENMAHIGIPDVILDVYKDIYAFSDMDIFIRPAQKFFSLNEKQQSIYGSGRITPLWEDSGTTISAFNHSLDNSGFFLFDLETAFSSIPQTISWIELSKITIIQMLESDIKRGEIETFAKAIGVEDLSKL